MSDKLGNRRSKRRVPAHIRWVQPYYPSQYDFDEPAERAIATLPAETKTALIAEWRGAVPARTPYTDAEILAAYARVVVEQVIKRARTAAYKTVTW